MLAKTFLNRSKRNFRATVIAMSFSVAIFIIAGGFYDQMTRFAEVQWEMVDANATIRVDVNTSQEVDCEGFDENAEGASWWGSQDENGEWVNRTCYVAIDANDVVRTVDEFNELHDRLEGILNEGDRLFGVANEGWTTRKSIELPASAFTSEFLRFREDAWGESQEYYELDVELIVIDDAFATQLAELAGVDVGSNILINHGRGWLDGGRVMDFEILNFDYQTLNVSVWDDGFERILEGSEMEFELHGQVTSANRPSQLGGSPWSIRVVVPQTNLDVMQMHWFIQTEDSTRVVEEGESLLFDYFEESVVNIFALDLDADELMARNIMGLVMFFMFAFVGVLILIGLTNVISTISENVRTRSKEFAVLQSVGMTGGGIKRMLNLESVFSSLRALVIGLPLGIIGAYGIYLALENVADFSFNIPWIWTISSVVAVFITTWTTMYYAAGRLKKQNIIETIRNGSAM
jgi:putative ABC transport system permease protein